MGHVWVALRNCAADDGGLEEKILGIFSDADTAKQQVGEYAKARKYPELKWAWEEESYWLADFPDSRDLFFTVEKYPFNALSEP